jgi:hypothetical protein
MLFFNAWLLKKQYDTVSLNAKRGALAAVFSSLPAAASRVPTRA